MLSHASTHSTAHTLTFLLGPGTVELIKCLVFLSLRNRPGEHLLRVLRSRIQHVGYANSDENYYCRDRCQAYGCILLSTPKARAHKELWFPDLDSGMRLGGEF